MGERRSFAIGKGLDLPINGAPKQVVEEGPTLRRVALVGHSLGGGIALRVVGALNKPVAGLVLVGSVVDATFPGAEKRPFWKDFSDRKSVV